jgi:hypothetical protein
MVLAQWNMKLHQPFSVISGVKDVELCVADLDWDHARTARKDFVKLKGAPPP